MRGRLVGWGHARARSVRDGSGLLRVRPWRARYSGCERTHVLLSWAQGPPLPAESVHRFRLRFHQLGLGQGGVGAEHLRVERRDPQEPVDVLRLC
jgi:hypothetical protein